MPQLPDLPVTAILPDLLDALAGPGMAVLEAPPGAGKTTLVPLALLDAAWSDGGRIIVLEPRRLATRAAAGRMAELLGEEVGRTVGYAMRFERRLGRDTRIEVLTEGLFLRRLQADPDLAGVAAVLFDEFHERSLDADLALALTLDARAVLRPDLRLLVMSATLDGTPVARLLDDAPILRSAGRMFPVETRHLGRDADEPIERAVVRACLHAVATEPGSILAFLPGRAEIERATAQLRERLADQPTIEIHPLFGDLPKDAQARAIAPSAPGRRKLVLATDIAETSLTIEGVRVVVDGGLARKPRFSPRHGTHTLVTGRIALANAEQRRGRAGRTGPGLCLRLWSVQEERAMAPFLPPEIVDSDLSALVLELRAWGVRDPANLRWLTPPPAAALAVAATTLAELGALAPDGQLTELGRRMLALPLDPRPAAMVLRAQALGAADTGAALAVLLSIRGTGRHGSIDLAERLDALRSGPLAETRETLRLAGQVLGRRLDPGRLRPELAGPILAAGFPDRIARRRGRGSFQLVGGRGVVLPAGDRLAASPWIVVADLDDRGADARAHLAAALDTADLPAERFVERTATSVDPTSGRVVGRTLTMLGALQVAVREFEPDPDDAAAALLAALLPRLGQILAACPAARALQRRVALLRGVEGEASDLPDLATPALAASAEHWLSPWLAGLRSLKEAEALDWAAILAGQLTHAQSARLETALPRRWTTPAGTSHAIDYDQDPPVFAARLQELFGVASGPVLAGGRVPLTLQLLSPAHRPAAVTADLAGFWRTGWPEVRKELRGRYPRHVWPEDPASATATTRAKPRG